MSSPDSSLRDRLQRMPIVAILRGIQSSEAAAIADVLVELRIEILEIPMNSPQPLRSIEVLAERLGAERLIGCGTVTSAGQLRDAYAAGARIVLHPHSDPALVALASELGMTSVPGVTSPTEAFAVLRAGADALKFFPSEIVSAPAVGAMKAVLPPDVLTISVGGVTELNMSDFWQAGVDGFGLGSRIYRPGWTPGEVARAAGPMIRIASELVATKAGIGAGS